MSRPAPTVRVLPTGHPTLTLRVNCSACGDIATGFEVERPEADQIAHEHRQMHRHPRRGQLAGCLVLLIGAVLFIGLALLAAYGARP